jgi:hypothetical protein
MNYSNKSFTRILSLVLVTVFVVMTGCLVLGERGNGKVTREERKVSSFDAIDVSGAFDIILAQGSTPGVIVETDENLLKIIKTDVHGGKLTIEQSKPIQHANSMKIFITVTDLKSIDMSGAVDVITEGRLTLPELSISGSGASDSKFDLDVRKLDVDCSGGSKLKFRGIATSTHMEVSGAVDLFAYDLVTDNFELDISGAGKAQINVNKEMNVDISGAGSVRYKGNPEKRIENVSGAGSIKKADE